MKKLFCLLTVFSLALIPMVGCGDTKEKDKKEKTEVKEKAEVKDKTEVKDKVEVKDTAEKK